jgi:hypothetical protein
VLLDQFSHDLSIQREGLDRLSLIFAHEATVSFHIRTQNGRELALKGLWRHMITPQIKKASRRIDLSTGGFAFTTFWNRKTMVSSQKVEVMLLNSRELCELNSIYTT